ncbi:hypothetical protein ACFWX5_14395 [[Kitasatospora] papulosa]|uniref:hypothetical protein n=1 Tax=[Kitasatospora] papulosa TaxID=1464011 RepID=UPI00296F8F0E
MLSYLAAALPAQTTAAARLLALQCALRSTAAGMVRLPAGLVRGMRLNSGTAPFAELEDARWLYSPVRPTTGREGLTVQLLDVAVRMQAPARRDRARAADWILRTCRAKELSRLGPLPRLVALGLACHPSACDPHTPRCAEQEILARLCGLTPRGIAHVLDVLTETRFLRSWTYGPALEDLRWELALPARSADGD